MSPRGLRYFLAPLLLCGGCDAATVMGPELSALTPPVSDGGIVRPPLPIAPWQVFEESVLPALLDRCGACHGDGGRATTFMAGPDIYVSVVASGTIVPGEPADSLLLTQGAHQGPAWEAEEALRVREWVELEGDLLDEGATLAEVPLAPVSLQSEPQVVVNGANVIDLSTILGEGSELRFSATIAPIGLRLSNVQVASGVSEVRLVHPRLITWLGGVPFPDPEDTYRAVDLTIPAGSLATLGNKLLFGFLEGSELSVELGTATPR